jgi:hypothetical protein
MPRGAWITGLCEDASISARTVSALAQRRCLKSQKSHGMPVDQRSAANNRVAVSSRLERNPSDLNR